MPKIGDIPTFVSLGDGESAIVTVDPSAESVSAISSYGTPIWHVPVILESGRKAIIRGGTRLVEPMQAAIGDATSPVKVRITAHGRARTTDRDYTVERVKS